MALAVPVGQELWVRNYAGFMRRFAALNGLQRLKVIADNVGDITRMGSDLFGSYVEASFATLVVASIFSYGFNHQFTVMMYPLLISSMGTIASLTPPFFATDIFEINVVKEIEPALKKQLIISIVFYHYWNYNCYLACAIIILYNFLFWRAKICEKLVRNYFFVLPFGQWVTSVIDFVIEYSTRNAYSPVLDVDSCRIGTATNIILGLALGYKSVIILIFTIADVVGKSHLIRERTDTLDATRIITDLLIWFLWYSLVPL
ncbi:hypothetical protein IFM89_001775 [Coptis chinensis]|uniref:H(+)-exporting diphosphatase n=1 Tax=Coptis chinensis TaxID=261450 RepID=A0A835LQH2_9MAGN|nr:hypothetical protein IFM89_001775 [Coptis chinensis]